MENKVTMKQKVYVEILQQLRAIIEADGLQQGDKLPSERELAERLQVARSSVREALRALELVGLIETRRGEGTFIKDAQNNELIQVIAAFVLQAREAKDDLKETTEIIETQAVSLARNRISEQEVMKLTEVYESFINCEQPLSSLHMDQHERFYRLILKASGNHLLFRIWMMLNNYYQTVCGSVSQYKLEHYEAVYEKLKGVKEPK